jgi:hypothetical protein
LRRSYRWISLIGLGSIQASFATLPGCFGNGNANLAACLPVTAGTGNSQIRITNDIVRVGVNYRFGGPIAVNY